MSAVKCLRLPWAKITIDIWRWQSWKFSVSWNSWAQYLQLNYLSLHSQYCPHVHAVPCIDLIGSFLQCHTLVFNIWVTIWLWRDGWQIWDHGKLQWQHQNSPGPIVRSAREPHLIKNLNYRIGMRWPRFWKHHAMGLIQVHTFPLFGIVIELLTCLSRRYPGIDILLKISQPYVLVELWTKITTALKMRKVVYSNFSPVKSTSSDCSASIKLPSGSPSHGLSLDDYSGSQPVGWRAYLA